MGVIESATRLFDLLSSRDDTFTKYLIAGLPEADIARLMAPTGIELPAEVTAFYNRFNLPSGYAYREDQPYFHGIYWLLGLEDAVTGLLFQRQFWADPDSGKLTKEAAGWFPLLQEDANYYVLDTAGAHEGRCPVLYASEYDEPKPEFASLEAMFDTLYHWVNERVLALEHGGVVGSYEGDSRRVAEIACRFNPEIDRWRASSE